MADTPTEQDEAVPRSTPGATPEAAWPNQPWPRYVRAGQLDEALAAHLAEADPDAKVTQLLDELLELRRQLRAKGWEQAERVAGRLEPEISTLTPNLKQEVAVLKESDELLERGEAEEALVRLEHIQLPLLLAEAETLRGTAQVFLGAAGAAEHAFRRATERDPKHYRAVTNLGNVMLEQGRTDEAIALYQTALKLNDGFSNAHHNLGVAYRRKGRVHKSVQALRKAQRVDRQRDREEARSMLKTFAQKRRSNILRWVLYVAAAIGLFLLLRSQGVL